MYEYKDVVYEHGYEYKVEKKFAILILFLVKIS